jgi:toxin YoeB
MTNCGHEDELKVHAAACWSLKRLNHLIVEASRDPSSGVGKPERLSGDLAGYWSRRIDQEHRLVCTLRGDDLVIVQARYHY